MIPVDLLHFKKSWTVSKLNLQWPLYELFILNLLWIGSLVGDTHTPKKNFVYKSVYKEVCFYLGVHEPHELCVPLRRPSPTVWLSRTHGHFQIWLLSLPLGCYPRLSLPAVPLCSLSRRALQTQSRQQDGSVRQQHTARLRKCTEVSRIQENVQATVLPLH